MVSLHENMHYPEFQAQVKLTRRKWLIYISKFFDYYTLLKSEAALYVTGNN